MGPYSFVRMWDEGDGFVPARLALRHELGTPRHGYWSPGWLGGVDRLSQSHDSVDGLLFVALPGWMAYALILTLQRFVAAYGAYRLARDDLGLAPMPAGYASLAYSMAAQPGYFAWGFSVMDLMALPGIPLVLWCLARTMRRRGWRSLGLTVAVAAAYSLLSHYFIGVFGVLSIAVWILLTRPAPRSRMIVHGLVFLATWCAFQAPAVVAAVVQSPFSQRASYGPLAQPTVEGSIETVTELLVDLAPATVLLALGVLLSRLRTPLVVLIGLASLGMIAVFMLHTVAHPLLQIHARVLAGFNVDRILEMHPFFTIMGAALTLNRLYSSRIASLHRLSRALVVVALLIPAGRVALAKPANLRAALDGVTFADLYAHSAVAALGQSRGSEPFRVATIMADNQHATLAWAYGLDTADGYLNLYPVRYRDYWLTVVRGLTKDDTRILRYLSEWGNRVCLCSPTVGFPPEPVPIDRYFDLDLLSLSNVRFIVSPVSLTSPTLRAVASPDARQLAWRQLTPAQKASSMWHGHRRPERPLYVYENLAVLPRYRLLHRLVALPTDADVLTALADATVTDLASTGFTAAPGVSGFDNAAGGRIELREETADAKAFVVQTDEQAVLFVGDAYNPYWTAHVDGAAAAVVPIDGAFQGVILTPGDHYVRLEYRPPYPWIRSGR